MAEKVGRKQRMTADEKAELVSRLLCAKSMTGKSFDEIAKELDLTNAYTVQLFMRQAQLKPETVVKLSKAVPSISPEDLLEMQQCPMRSFDPNIMQEPLVYRLVEAMQHYGESIKILVNEKLGDGIMSAIDFYLTVNSLKGVAGEDRVVVTMNGKYLPHIEQLAINNTANTF